MPQNMKRQAIYTSDLAGRESIYLTPITTVHSTLEEAKKSYYRFRGPWHEEVELLSVATLALGKRNLIVGEPGVGKSLLLNKIEKHLEAEGATTAFVSLRQSSAAERLKSHLENGSRLPNALILDGLDEVKASLLPSIIEYINELSAAHPQLLLFLSGRWAFINRYSTSFQEYRYITVHPFTRRQVKEYLVIAGHAESDIDTLIGRLLSFGHQTLVLQIPRYLFYLDDFLEKKGWEAAAQVTRNELFDYFIYKKLELEDKKLNSDKRAVIKRVLEKLALTMEIYQANVIDKDQLMTFFDDLRSDLKVVALAQVGVEVLYDYSLLRLSDEGLDKIEFENTEFQEFLAAKEVTRFSDPSRAAFAFAVDPFIKEILPTWYNTLTFLSDMQPELLQQLIEFSGLRGDKFKVMDESFLTFISRLDSRQILPEVRQSLFRDVIEYHERTRQWLSDPLANALPSFFDPSLELYLKNCAVMAEQSSGAQRFVPLGNLAYALGYLLPKASLDRPYWRERLIGYACDSSDTGGVLQRQALFALQQLGDPTVIDQLPTFRGSDELVYRGYLALCTALAPDNPRCVGYFISAIRDEEELYGRYGLFSVKKAESIKVYLRELVSDHDFLRGFLNQAPIFRDQDSSLAENIEGVLDQEMVELCREVIVKSVHYAFLHNTRDSTFIRDLWKLLRKVDDNFLVDMANRLIASNEGPLILYGTDEFFAVAIEISDVEPFVKALIASNEECFAANTMRSVKLSKRENAEDIYEAGRSLLAKRYQSWEESLVDSHTVRADRTDSLIREFRRLLEPEPEKYDPGVLRFYVEHEKELNPVLSEQDRGQISKIIRECVLDTVDPGQHGLQIVSEIGGSKTFRTNEGIGVFGDALIAGKQLGIDMTPYRQKILNYIPFAYNEYLRVIFDLVPQITPDEIAPVVEIYRTRHTDLWRHQPDSFVSAVERYHVAGAAPVLKEFIVNSMWDVYIRRKALTVLDSTAPDIDFLSRLFDSYKDSGDEVERTLAEIANSLLVSNHSDAQAIKWRLGQVVGRASAHVRPRGTRAHSVGDLEDELLFGKGFARPLMSLRDTGYEEGYLELLDSAMAIWKRGSEFQDYAVYLWDIVLAYFENLKEGQSYVPLRLLEDKVSSMKDMEGANWLAGRLVHLRRSYLSYLGKPDNISVAIAKYNDVRSYNSKKIQSSADLFNHLQDALEVQVRHWIEGEGAYDILSFKARAGAQQYEKLVQRTLKAQIENILLRDGFEVEVLREPQLLDDKRTDFLVHYGFAGPIVIEVKLTSNPDLKSASLERTPSYYSMERYMHGYGADYGIFLVIDNNQATNMAQVRKVFQTIKGVRVISFSCDMAISSRPQSKRKSKK